MKRSDGIQMLKHSIKRNQVKIIILILSILAGLAIGGYAGVQAYYNGWLGISYITEGDRVC